MFILSQTEQLHFVGAEMNMKSDGTHIYQSCKKLEHFSETSIKLMIISGSNKNPRRISKL
jgi:hypothetical protein